MERVTCTLQLARRRHPAGPNSLDALCKRYGIDNSKRTKHGALMDSVLLAEVYIELLGVRQAALGLAMEGTAPLNGETGAFHKRKAAQRPAPLPSRLTAEAEAEHRAFIETLGVKALWRRYLAFAASVASATRESLTNMPHALDYDGAQLDLGAALAASSCCRRI